MHLLSLFRCGMGDISPVGDLLFPRRKSRQNAVGGRCGVNLGIHLDLHSAYPRTPVYEGIEQSHFCTNPALLSVALSASDAPLPLKCASLRALALFVMQRAWCDGAVPVRLSLTETKLAMASCRIRRAVPINAADENLEQISGSGARGKDGPDFGAPRIESCTAG